MTLAVRKKQELLAKLDSLKSEFEHWRDASEAGQPLEKHFSQIRRVIGRLGPVEQSLRDRIEELAGDGALLASAAMGREILEVHRIWAFFRTKLLLRREEPFRRYLIAADELAWACYEPMREAAKASIPEGALKEPPLTFLSGASVPAASARESLFIAEYIMPFEKIENQELLDLLRSLPVPVIGMPWYSAWHLPDILILAHETGHVVASDLGLQKEFDARLDSAHLSPVRSAAWRVWANEVFADVFGTLAAGPSFVSTLMDFLASDPAVLAAETRAEPPPGWGSYPTAALRVLLCLRVLERVEDRTVQRYSWDDAGQEMRVIEQLYGQWAALFSRDAQGGIIHDMRAYEGDIDSVVSAMLGPYSALGGNEPWDALLFKPVDYKITRASASRLLAGQDPDSLAPMMILPAVRLAYEEDPGNYAGSGISERAMELLERGRHRGTRFLGGAYTPPDPQAEREVEEYDRAQALVLMKRIATAS